MPEARWQTTLRVRQNGETDAGLTAMALGHFAKGLQKQDPEGDVDFDVSSRQVQTEQAGSLQDLRERFDTQLPEACAPYKDELLEIVLGWLRDGGDA